MKFFSKKNYKKTKMKKAKGFTLIELLVVIAIIGLLSTLAVVALNNARQKSRDAKRVSDVKQVSTALELYFADNNGYPTAATAITLGDATHTCLGTNGFATECTGTTYMGQVPSAPTPPTGNTYTYTSADGSTYSIGFTLEGTTGGLEAGAHTATPSGLN
ncbi:MAG: prepilin-type N-terminal cleavage/methylation domain-containing protein [Patescibacteria group bacterium]